MAWTEAVTPTALRELKGNLDNCYDGELQAYINALVVDIEYLTGLDFDFTDAEVTQVFRNTKRKNEFVLGDTRLLVGAWRSITLVERSYISANPSYSEMTEFSDYTLESPRIQGFEPLTEIYFLCQRLPYHEQIRLTGVQGFSDNIPADLQYIMAEMVDAYYNRLASGIGPYEVKTEKSLTRSVSFQLNGLTSIQIYTPARIREFYNIIMKYNVKNTYPF